MKIHGIEGMTTNEINEELHRGAKFVLYQYCISVLVMTFKRGTDVFSSNWAKVPLVKAWDGPFLRFSWAGGEYPGAQYTQLAV
jgi:hypothetical protein